VARLARLALPGYPHLVSHRSGARALIVDDEDAHRLLQGLRQALLDADVALHGYTLLPRDLWLLATPVDAGGLGRAMQSIGRRFVRWVNDRRGEHGGIFSGRYRAAAIEPEADSLRALAYVETMPLRAVQGATLDQYFWSSCRVHLGLGSDPHLQQLPAYWALGNTPFDRQAAYRRLLDAGVGADETKRFARALAGGWVVGSPGFVRQIEAQCSRRPRPARPGRPRRGAMPPRG
jgi:REP-associated tyrosine transposase